MPRGVPTNICAIAAKCDEKFTQAELLKKGGTHNGVKKAIEEGLIKVLKTVESTGKRGRPATHLTLTAKGKKAAAK